MEKQAAYHLFNIAVRKRPWYIWISRIAWFFWLAMWTEFAVGSLQEGERQAYSIAVRVLFLSFLLGLALFLWRSREAAKQQRAGDS